MYLLIPALNSIGVGHFSGFMVNCISYVWSVSFWLSYHCSMCFCPSERVHFGDFGIHFKPTDPESSITYKIRWGCRRWPFVLKFDVKPHQSSGNLIITSQIAKFMGPTWAPPGPYRPQMSPMLAPWTLLSGMVAHESVRQRYIWVSRPHGSLQNGHIITKPNQTMPIAYDVY